VGYGEITLSQTILGRGRVKKNRKYIVVRYCPKVSNGASTGCPPIQVRREQIARKDQNISWEVG